MALLPILIVLAGIAGYALDQREKTEAIILARQLATRSSVVRKDYPQHSLLLAVEAVNATGNLPREPAAEQALRDALAWTQGTGGIYLGNNNDLPNHWSASVLAISPDSRWLAGSIGGELVLRDLMQPTPVTQTLSSLRPIAVAFSSDSHWLAAVNVDDHSSVQLWQLTDKATAHCTLGPFDKEVQMILTTTTSWIATLDKSGLQLWNPENCKLLDRLDQDFQLPVILRGFANNDRWLVVWYPFIQKTSVVSLDVCGQPNCSPSWRSTRDIDGATQTWLSPDGRWLATGGHFLGLGPPGKKSPVRLWDLWQDELQPIELQCYACKTDDIQTFEFSRNAKWLAAVDGSTAYLWHRDSDNSGYIFDGKLLSQEQEAMQAPLRFTDDERWLVIAGKSGRAWVWDLNSVVRSGLQGHQLSDPITSIIGIETSPDSQWIAITGADQTVRLWSPSATAPDRQPVQLRIHGAQIEKVLFSRDSRWLVTVAGDGAWLWEMAKLQSSIEPILLQDNIQWPGQPSKHLAVSADGRWLFIGSDPWQRWRFDDTGFQMIPTSTDNPRPFSVAFSSGAELFLFGPGGRITRQDLDQDAYDEVLPSGKIFAIRFAVSADGRWLIREQELYELSSGTGQAESRPLQVGFPMAFSPDSRWLLAQDLSRAMYVYDLSNRSFSSSPIHLDTRTGTWPSEWSFSADGRSLAVLDDTRSRLRVWELDGKPYMAAKMCDRISYYLVSAFTLSPDGRRLATADSEGNLAIWSLKGRSTECNWEGTLTNRRNGSIGKLVFSSDGRKLMATGGRSSWPNTDTVVLVWDIAEAVQQSDPVELLNLHFTYSGVPFYGDDFVLVRPDGVDRWLAFDSGLGQIYLARLSLDELITLACQTAGRNLTKEEWRRYMGQVPYRATCPSWPVHSSIADITATPIP